jgi:hypothetical protein
MKKFLDPFFSFIDRMERAKKQFHAPVPLMSAYSGPLLTKPRKSSKNIDHILKSDLGGGTLLISGLNFSP